MLTKHVDSVDPISNIHESRNSAKKGGLPSLDNAVPPIQRIFDRTTAVSPTVSACGTSMRGTVGPLNSSANYGITSKQAYSCERFLPLSGHTTSPVVGSIIMHEKVPSRKIGTTAPYMSTNVHFNVTKKGSYSTQIYKDGLATVNDHIEQKVSSSDGSKNNLARYKLYDFKLSHAEKSSKRFPMSEQTVFDMAPNIPQSGFIDTTNRGYAAKSIIAPFSMKPASIGQNSFTSFVNDEYGTMRAQAGHARQADSFNCELSMATISRKISNEHDRSRHRNSQEGTISGQEYMKRLLQAHQVVDELLKSRGLIPEDEVDYLRNWRQKVNREPKIEERNAADVSDPAVSKNAESFDTSEASQQRCISNASDSGLSMDADSENDLRSSSKLRELNSQNSIVTDLLPFKKQETISIKSVKVNIVKTMKHMNVYLKVIIRRPQHCWQYMDVKMGIEKKEAVSEKTTNSNATENSKKSCNKRRQTIDGKTEQVKSGNEKNSLTQNKRLNQDHQMAMATASGQFKSTSSQELSSAKSNKSETGKKHNIFISKPKYEEVDVCCSFTNKICCLYKATISLPIARCAAVKQKSIAVRDKKLLEKKGKEPKSKCNKDDSVHASLLANTGKLPFNLKMIPELQNMENKRKIRVARKGEEMVESKDIITEIKKDILDLKKTKKCFKFPIPLKESEESHNLLPVKYTKKITPSQTRKTSPSSKQITVSRNLCLQSKLPRLETAMIMPLRSHKIKITKPVMIKQTVDNKKQQREGLLRANNPSVLKIKECVELKKTQKVLQNYTTVTTKYYQKILRSTAGNESNIMTGYEGNAGIDIRRAREHLRRVNFNKTSVKLESSTSFVHRISEDPVKLSDTSIPSSVTSSEQGSSVLSAVKKKAKKKVSGTKMDKGSKDRSAGTHTTSIEKAERNSDILDRELVNAYRRTQRIPKPQARIPAWNVCDERKQAAGTIWSPPKLCYGTLPTAPPVVPCFIRVRTPTPIDIAATLSTPAPTITVLRHVPAKHLPILTPRPKNTLSSDSGVTIAGSLQQHSPSNQFGVTLKRVDRSTMQKSKPRGAITQSAPKKPWVPKWRRIQRTDEGEEETIPVIEMNKDEHRSDDEQEEKQMSIRLSSQVVIEKNGKDMTEAEKAMMVAKRRQIKEETAKLQEYEEKRRVEREREEEELRKLKEKKERRKLEREEEERQFQERFRQEEEKRKQEEEERKAKMEAEKRKKEDEKRKRQQMLSSQFSNTAPGQMGRNFVIPQKSNRADKFGNIVQAKQEMSMTKEQQEEAKRNYLVSVKHTIEFEKVAPAELREKIRQLHQRICKLEADKYDLEKRHERQEYDLRELNERQRQVARNKALKKGLDPADTNSRHPRCVMPSSKDAILVVRAIPTTAKSEMTVDPKVSIVSKYDRQIDRRNFRERRAMFENKTAYPCFPNVPPPPTVYKKMILSDDKGDEPEDEDDEVDEQEEEEEEEEDEEEE